MLKELGLERFDKERYKIIDFGSKNAVLVLNDIQSDIEKMNLLVLLCKFDYIDKALVYEIIENETLVSSALEKFYVLGICDYLGVAQEYIRVNDIIKDYIVRSNYEIPKKLKQ